MGNFSHNFTITKETRGEGGGGGGRDEWQRN
jgi:hypothetical protein